MCHSGLPELFQANAGSLVNPNEIDYIEFSRFATSVVFKGTNKRASIAKYKAKHLAKFFPTVKV